MYLWYGLTMCILLTQLVHICLWTRFLCFFSCIIWSNSDSDISCSVTGGGLRACPTSFIMPAHQASQAELLWSHFKRALVISLPLGGQLQEKRRQKLQPTPACSDCSKRRKKRERMGPPLWHGRMQIPFMGSFFFFFFTGYPGQR